MKQTINLNDLNSKIRTMRECAEEMQRMGDEFPALYRNAVRILASLKMLELNISDITE